MLKISSIVSIVLIVVIGIITVVTFTKKSPVSQQSLVAKPKVQLPTRINNRLTLLLEKRRSRRSFTKKLLNLQQLSTLLWSAQGLSGNGRFRTAPSAGALYPLTLYVIIKRINQVSPGLYRYNNMTNTLIRLEKDNKYKDIATLSYNQKWINEAPAIIIISGNPRITQKKYGARSTLYVAIEVGAVTENIYLQAEQLQLATTLVSGFDEVGVQKLLKIPQIPYALMPIGYASDTPASSHQDAPRQ